MGQAHRIGKEEKVKSTVVKPTNGQASKRKLKTQNRSRSSGFSLRRLTKRQREKLARIFVTAFIVIFLISIVGGLVYLVTQPGVAH